MSSGNFESEFDDAKLTKYVLEKVQHVRKER